MEEQPTCSKYLNPGSVQHSTNKPFLELHFIYFLLMHPARIISFIKAIGDLLEKMDETFLNELDKKATRQGVLENWKDVIDSGDSELSTAGKSKRSKTGADEIKKNSDFYFLTTTYWSGRNPCPFNDKKTDLKTFTSSLSNLLKTMRNKIVHFELFPSEAKEKLKWAIEKDNTFIFGDSLFVEYWNNRFPELFYFLWKEFHCFRAHLKVYYPCDFDSRTVNWNNRLSEELANLSEALNTDFLKHGMTGCYTTVDQYVKMEFRNLTDIFSLPLGEYYAAYIGISDKGLKIIFRNRQGTCTPVYYNIFNSSQEPLSIVVKLSKKELDLKFLNHCAGSNRVIVFLPDSNDMSCVLKQMEEGVFDQKFKLVVWKELHEQEQTVVLHRYIQVQNKYNKFWTILPENCIREPILRSMAAGELQILFEKSVLALFSKVSIPKIKDFYVKRKIVLLDKEQSETRLKEEDWIRQIETNKQLIFLCDNPGQGKSTFILNFARQTSAFLVIHTSAIQFGLLLKEQLEKQVNKQFDKYNAIDALSEMFGLTRFEEMILSALISGKVGGRHVLLLVDALDEANQETRKLIINAVAIIQESFPFVQICATMRGNVYPDETNQINVNATCCKLCPLNLKA